VPIQPPPPPEKLSGEKTPTGRGLSGCVRQALKGELIRINRRGAHAASRDCGAVKSTPDFGELISVRAFRPFVLFLFDQFRNAAALAVVTRARQNFAKMF
jgi:hypothetical protein